MPMRPTFGRRGLLSTPQRPATVAPSCSTVSTVTLTEFIAVSYWDDMESIANFAGDDVNSAVFYPQDDHYLIDRETAVHHYTVTEPDSS